jgi:hypothetical protein
MAAWTVLAGLAVVCAVLIVILLVARLAKRFRHEQRGFPVTPSDEGIPEADVHPSRS